MVGHNLKQRKVRRAAHIWNHSVALDRRYYQLFGKSLKQAQLQKHLAKLRRTRFRHWRLVDFQSLQAVTDRLYRGRDAWFKREIQWPPTFRSRPKHTSFTLKQSGWIVGPGKLRIQRRVYRFHQSREIAGTVQTLTIRRDAAGRHFVSFCCAEVPKPEALVKTGQATGADFGLKTFLALSTGEKIDSPQPLKHALRKLRSANRSLSRKQKGSHSRRKARLDLARIHRRVSHQRTHFHWQLASRLVKEFDDLAFEDLHRKAMHLIGGRKVGDLGRDFLAKQEWLAEKYGRRMGKAPPFEPTTKRMSCCGHIQDVALGERTVQCRRCGATHDRDINAAKSILEACRRLRSGAGCKTSPEAVRAITAESRGF